MTVWRSKPAYYLGQALGAVVLTGICAWQHFASKDAEQQHAQAQAAKVKSEAEIEALARDLYEDLGVGLGWDWMLDETRDKWRERARSLHESGWRRTAPDGA